MSDAHPPTDPELDEDDLLAAEHALGVLDSSERDAAERRALTDPAFAGRVESWRLRLSALLDGLAPVPAPETVWPRIVQGLGALGNVVELKLRRSVVIWRSVSAVAASVAAVLAVVAVWPRPEGPSPVMTSEIATANKGPVVYVAMMDPAHHRVILQPVSMTTTPGRAPELWLIGPDGKPVAIGVAEFAKPVELNFNKIPTGAEVLAVSLEPVGGSPTGQPTGPVVATGKLQLL
jgi:anti-sigma-K factor RskA